MPPTPNSQRLAGRARQPGHDRGWVASERSVEQWCRLLLPEGYRITAQPGDLADLYAAAGAGRAAGLLPELKIECLRTGRYVFVEVKRQGDHGNAEERVYKLFTAQFMATVAARCRLPYHPFIAVLLGRESLAGQEPMCGSQQGGGPIFVGHLRDRRR